MRYKEENTHSGGLKRQYEDETGQVGSVIFCIDNIREYQRIIIDHIEVEFQSRRKKVGTLMLLGLCRDYPNSVLVPNNIKGSAQSFWLNALAFLEKNGFKVEKEISFSERAEEIVKDDAARFWKENT